MNHDGALAGERFADILLDLLPGRLVAEPGPNKSKQIDELLLRQGACKSRHGRAAHTFRGRQSPENDIEDIARIGAARPVLRERSMPPKGPRACPSWQLAHVAW